jgi:hypothetical protein
MGSENHKKQTIFGSVKPFCSSVDQDVMYDEIQHSIQTDSYSYPKSVIEIFYSQKEQYNRNASEKQ